jgi:hypothetical protein
MNNNITKAVVLFTVSFFIICKTNASTVLASSYGYNTTNATTALQAAILSTNDTIIVDLQSSNWKVAPLTFFNLSNKIIILKENVVLEAISGAFNATGACLLRFNNSQNISIIGYSATLKMNKAEYALLNDSEYRHSINLWNCSNIIIKGLTINESGGDGIYIGGDANDYCENIVIEDVICSNHYRQGMSITNVQNMTIRYCKFKNTQGTLPEAGIDVEPYQTTQRIVNLKIENCAFEGNGWAGLALALFEMDGTSLPVSIEVIDCYFKNNSIPTNAYAHCEIYLSADDNIPVQGFVQFERCFIDGSQYSALYTRKTAAAYLVNFKDCAFQNVSQQQIQYNEPIFLEVPSYTNPSGYLGGLEFENVLISYSTNFSFFRVFGWGTLQGIKDINGNFTIVEPNNNPVLYTTVPSIINCNYTFSNQTSLPSATVSLGTIENTAVECSGQNAVFKVKRTSNDISYPLGVNYQNNGTVFLGSDTHNQNNGFIIPADTIQSTKYILARQDGVVEPNEILNFSFQNNPLYSVSGNNLMTLNIVDCASLAISNSVKDSFKIYPNPTSDFITIENPNNQDLQIQFFNMIGQALIIKNISKTENILITELLPGSYIVHISNKEKDIRIVRIIVKK